MSLDNIIHRILSDANAQAEGFVRDAEAKAKEMLAKAGEESRVLADRIMEDARIRSEEEAKRSLVIKGLEVKKEIGKKKLALIDGAFRASYGRLLSLDSVRYLDIIEKGIMHIREREGKILFSKKDSDRITSDFVDRVNKTRGLRFVFGGYFDSEDGGFLLVQDRVTIDMTFSTVLKDLREKVIFEAAALLFG